MVLEAVPMEGEGSLPDLQPFPTSLWARPGQALSKASPISRAATRPQAALQPLSLTKGPAISCSRLSF